MISVFLSGKKSWITGLISSLTWITVSAQQSEKITLESAVSTALKNSLEIEVSKNTVNSQILLNHYGVAGGLPTISAAANDQEQIMTINQNLTNGTEISRKGAAGNNLSGNVTGTIVLYNGNRITSTKKRLEQLTVQSQEVLNSQIQNITADVMTAYFDIVRQQSYLRTISQSIVASEKRLEILKVRQLAGMANNADIFQAQIDLNTLNLSQQNQNLVVDVAKTELVRLLGLDAQTAIAVSDTITVDGTVNLSEILQSIPSNKDILAANSQIRINELLAKETAAQRYPTVRLNAGYNYTRNQSAAGFTLLNQSYGPNASLNVAIPIYNGSAFKRQQRVAEIATINAGKQRDILVRDYTSDATKAFQAYRNSIGQLRLEQENFKLSRQLLDLTMQRFELQQATIIEVREAQKSFEDAGYRLVNLNFAAKSSEIELKRIAGQL